MLNLQLQGQMNKQFFPNGQVSMILIQILIYMKKCFLQIVIVTYLIKIRQKSIIKNKKHGYQLNTQIIIILMLQAVLQQLKRVQLKKVFMLLIKKVANNY